MQNTMRSSPGIYPWALLFLIYINDLCNVSDVLDSILFADDTNIFFNEIKFLSKTINNELAKLTQRFLANKLSINLKKSSYIIFRPRQKRQTLDLSVKINDNLIARAKETVFLGVILVENLSWKPHILNVSRKISKSIGIIYKASFCPPSTALVTILYII